MDAERAAILVLLDIVEAILPAEGAEIGGRRVRAGELTLHLRLARRALEREERDPQS